MNLTCHEDGYAVPLWQTPTHITYMCLSYHPETRKPDGGHEGVRRRYLLWVESSTNGVWKSSDDLRAQEECAREHCAHIRGLKRPHFSYT